MKPPRRQLADRLFTGFLCLFALVLVVLVAALLGILLRGAWPVLTGFGVSRLLARDWNPSRHSFGALTFLYGTFASSLLGTVFATVVGVGTALLLTQFGHAFLIKTIRSLVDLLTAIPSVVYGLWGLFALVPWLQRIGEPFLHHWFGFLPLFQGPSQGAGMLAAGLILGVMILPTIITVIRQVMDSVPQELKDGAIALGATRTEKVRMVILPYARVGIIGAVLLSMGRALGEAIAVTMVIGDSPEISRSLFAPGETLASLLAKKFLLTGAPLYRSSMYEMGLLLFLVTLLFYGASKLMVWQVSRRVNAI